MKTNYMQVIEQTEEEQTEMYLKLPKWQIILMLIEANKHLKNLSRVDAEVKPACDVADIKIKAKLMENKYWLNFLTLDTTNIIHKSCLEDRITELEKIQNENRKSV